MSKLHNIVFSAESLGGLRRRGSTQCHTAWWQAPACSDRASCQAEANGCTFFFVNIHFSTKYTLFHKIYTFCTKYTFVEQNIHFLKKIYSY